MNPFEMIKNLQEMQANVQKMQARLSSVTAMGSAGGDLVKLELNGQMEIVSLQIDPSCVDKNEVVLLQDLVRSAHTDALSKIREKMKEEAGGLMPNFNLPGMA